MSQTALVVGGTGPTGPYIVEGLLQRGYQVAILHRGEHEGGCQASRSWLAWQLTAAGRGSTRK